MLRSLIGLASRLEGLEQIVLSVTAHNETAKKLYDSLGFQVFGREPRALRANGEYFDEEHRVLLLNIVKLDGEW